jgi:hypothetical protein
MQPCCRPSTVLTLSRNNPYSAIHGENDLCDPRLVWHTIQQFLDGQDLVLVKRPVNAAG